MLILIWGDLDLAVIEASSIVVDKGFSNKDESGSINIASDPLPKSIELFMLDSKYWTEDDQADIDTSELKEESI